MVEILGSLSNRECLGAPAMLPTTEDGECTETFTAEE